MAQLDINELAGRYDVYDVSVRSQEDPQEQAHRHRIEWLDARVQQGKGVLLFVCALGGVGVVLWYCVTTLLAPTTAPEEKKWALSAVTSILSGLIGFLTGKALK
jgi:hypothetical protein